MSEEDEYARRSGSRTSSSRLFDRDDVDHSDRKMRRSSSVEEEDRYERRKSDHSRSNRRESTKYDDYARSSTRDSLRERDEGRRGSSRSTSSGSGKTSSKKSDEVYSNSSGTIPSKLVKEDEDGRHFQLPSLTEAKAAWQPRHNQEVENVNDEGTKCQNLKECLVNRSLRISNVPFYWSDLDLKEAIETAMQNEHLKCSNDTATLSFTASLRTGEFDVEFYSASMATKALNLSGYPYFSGLQNQRPLELTRRVDFAGPAPSTTWETFCAGRDTAQVARETKIDHARRTLMITNLPSGIQSDGLRRIVVQAFVERSLMSISTDPRGLVTFIRAEGSQACVTFRTQEEATAALQLDQMEVMNGSNVTITRLPGFSNTRERGEVKPLEKNFAKDQALGYQTKSIVRASSNSVQESEAILSRCIPKDSISDKMDKMAPNQQSYLPGKKESPSLVAQREDVSNRTLILRYVPRHWNGKQVAFAVDLAMHKEDLKMYEYATSSCQLGQPGEWTLGFNNATLASRALNLNGYPFFQYGNTVDTQAGIRISVSRPNNYKGPHFQKRITYDDFIMHKKPTQRAETFQEHFRRSIIVRNLPNETVRAHFHQWVNFEMKRRSLIEYPTIDTKGVLNFCQITGNMARLTVRTEEEAAALLELDANCNFKGMCLSFTRNESIKVHGHYGDPGSNHAPLRERNESSKVPSPVHATHERTAVDSFRDSRSEGHNSPRIAQERCVVQHNPSTALYCTDSTRGGNESHIKANAPGSEEVAVRSRGNQESHSHYGPQESERLADLCHENNRFFGGEGEESTSYYGPQPNERLADPCDENKRLRGNGADEDFSYYGPPASSGGTIIDVGNQYQDTLESVSSEGPMAHGVPNNAGDSHQNSENAVIGYNFTPSEGCKDTDCDDDDKSSQQLNNGHANLSRVKSFDQNIDRIPGEHSEAHVDASPRAGVEVEHKEVALKRSDIFQEHQERSPADNQSAALPGTTHGTGSKPISSPEVEEMENVLRRLQARLEGLTEDNTKKQQELDQATQSCDRAKGLLEKEESTKIELQKALTVITLEIKNSEKKTKDAVTERQEMKLAAERKFNRIRDRWNRKKIALDETMKQIGIETGKVYVVQLENGGNVVKSEHEILAASTEEDFPIKLFDGNVFSSSSSDSGGVNLEDTSLSISPDRRSRCRDEEEEDEDRPPQDNHHVQHCQGANHNENLSVDDGTNQWYL